MFFFFLLIWCFTDLVSNNILMKIFLLLTNNSVQSFQMIKYRHYILLVLKVFLIMSFSFFIGNLNSETMFLPDSLVIWYKNNFFKFCLVVHIQSTWHSYCVLFNFLVLHGFFNASLDVNLQFVIQRLSYLLSNISLMYWSENFWFTLFCILLLFSLTISQLLF